MIGSRAGQCCLAAAQRVAAPRRRRLNIDFVRRPYVRDSLMRIGWMGHEDPDYFASRFDYEAPELREYDNDQLLMALALCITLATPTAGSSE